MAAVCIDSYPGAPPFFRTRPLQDSLVPWPQLRENATCIHWPDSSLPLITIINTFTVFETYGGKDLGIIAYSRGIS